MREDVTITYPHIGQRVQVRIHTRCRAQFKTELQTQFQLRRGSETSGDVILDDLPPGRVPELMIYVKSEYPDWRINVYDRRPVYDRPGDRVGWASLPDGWSRKTVGVVGDLVLFELRQRATNRDETHQWQMVAQFPTQQTSPNGSWITGNHTTPEAAKRSAEVALDEFMAKLGAVWARFPESVIPPTD